MKNLIATLCVLLSCAASFSEEDRQISVTVLPTSDTSELGLAEPLHYALGQVLQSTGGLKVQLSGYSLTGFTPTDVEKAFDVLQSELISFTYLERTRISVFLFAKERPREFIVSFRALDESPNTRLSSELIETKFRESINDVLTSYNNGSFQPLPGSEPQTAYGDEEEIRRRANEARTLFRELAALEDRKWYIGANVGMARHFQTRTSDSTAHSTVNFGGCAGTRLNERFDLEAGIDAFSYLVLHGDIRYHIPFFEKYVNISLTGGVGNVIATVTENRQDTSIISPVGNMLFGPGLGFDVPLLGATIRGEVRYYLGATSLLVGSYGIILAI